MVWMTTYIYIERQIVWTILNKLSAGHIGGRIVSTQQLFTHPRLLRHIWLPTTCGTLGPGSHLHLGVGLYSTYKNPSSKFQKIALNQCPTYKSTNYLLIKTNWLSTGEVAVLNSPEWIVARRKEGRRRTPGLELDGADSRHLFLLSPSFSPTALFLLFTTSVFQFLQCSSYIHFSLFRLYISPLLLPFCTCC